MSDHVAASAEVWILNDHAYAASQVRTIWLMVAVPPRSTWSHCGSVKALDQRVPGSPSTAAAAGVPPFSLDAAVTGLACDNRAGAAAARPDQTGTSTATTNSTAEPAASQVRRSDDGVEMGCMRIPSRGEVSAQLRHVLFHD